MVNEATTLLSKEAVNEGKETLAKMQKEIVNGKDLPSRIFRISIILNIITCVVN